MPATEQSATRTIFLPVIAPRHPVMHGVNECSADGERLIWQSLNRRAARQIPSGVRAWLVDSDSLTRQMKRACGGQFRVRVLQQHWQRADWQAMTALGIARGTPLLIREVQLLCGDTPWVFARSLIPRACLRGHYAMLGEMGDRPLGEKLFADPVMVRRNVQFTSLTCGSHGYRRALMHQRARPKRIFGRRSLFIGARAPLMVMEFFLPASGAFPLPRR